MPPAAPPSVDGLEAQCRNWLMDPLPPEAQDSLDLLPSLVALIRTRDRELVEKLERPCEKYAFGTFRPGVVYGGLVEECVLCWPRGTREGE